MQKIFFPSGEETIAGNLFISHEENPMGVLILHGGGNGNKERFTDLQIVLEKGGIASLAIDFLGVGESTGTFQDGSLERRLGNARDALRELKKYADPNYLVVYGSSMGGYLAPIIAAEDNGVKAVIMTAGAAYHPNAENKPLTDAFTKVITQPKSWEHSKSFTALEHFQGKVLVIYGENDNIIPKEIQDRYNAIAEKKGEHCRIPLAGHNVTLAHNPQEQAAKDMAINRICSFLTKIRQEIV